MPEKSAMIDNIILSFLQGGISEKEKHILKEWLAKDASNKDYFKQYYQLWNAADLMPDNVKVERVLQKLKASIDENHHNAEKKFYSFSHVVKLCGKWAAVVILSAGLGAILYRQSVNNIPVLSEINELKGKYNEITVPLGSRSTAHLPDGTEVILNAGSSLIYHQDFGRVHREVTLSGEGYFKVAKQREHPFIVHTNKADIKALGTEFNVKAYPNEDIIEAILVKGIVTINETNGIKKTANVKKEEGIILKPGQKALIYKEVKKDGQVSADTDTNSGNMVKPALKPSKKGFPVVLESSDTKIETSWKDEGWIIKGENLKNLSVLLSRRYNVNIHLKDNDLISYKFSGTIQNETVEQVFQIMALTIPMSYSIDKGEVIWSINHELKNDYDKAYKKKQQL